MRIIVWVHNYFLIWKIKKSPNFSFNIFSIKNLSITNAFFLINKRTVFSLLSIIFTLFWTNQEAEASLISHNMICLEEKHTCGLSPPRCCWHISHSRTMGRGKDEKQMLHLSLGHGLVKQWSLQFPDISNILGTNGIIPSQVLCLALHLDETSPLGSSFDSLLRCCTGSLWGSIEGFLGSKGRERKKNIQAFLLFSFSPVFVSCFTFMCSQCPSFHFSDGYFPSPLSDMNSVCWPPK